VGGSCKIIYFGRMNKIITNFLLSAETPMSKMSRHRKAKGLRIAGRTIGSIATILSILLLIGLCTGHGQLDLFIVSLIGVTLAALAGLIIAWLDEPFAAILFFLSSAGLGFRSDYYQQPGLWLIIGLPCLLTSLLLLGSRLLSERRSRDTSGDPMAR
jgi:hypothetical protein